MNVIFYKVKRCFIIMKKGKNGQFFILAAVILSVFIFSLAFTVNEVIVQRNNFGFTDYAEGVEREANYVLDYQVYSGVSSSEIENFVSILEADYKDRGEEGNFMFIYGNSSLMRIKNLGTSGIRVGDGNAIVNGSSSLVGSKIKIKGVGSIQVNHYNDHNKTELKLDEANIGEFIEVDFNKYVYKFPVSNNSQVIFIIQKDVEDETYVEVK